jgi:alpha-galactosidase
VNLNLKQEISSIKWKWGHNLSKVVAYNKGSAQIKIYSIIHLVRKE